jgi:serine/threonine protein kinase
LVVAESRELVGGRYALLRQVGTGQMSTVWVAEDRRRQRQRVALKLLDTSHPDAIRHEIFRRETQSLERLNHPNIVRIWDHGWDSHRNCYFIALEYLGRTLVEEISRQPDPDGRERASAVRD